MKIVSQFNDYYDGVASSLFDKETLYIRKVAEELTGNKFELDRKNRYISYPDSATYMILFFCGKTYPIVRIFREISFSKKEVTYCYNYKAFEEAFASIKKQNTYYHHIYDFTYKFFEDYKNNNVNLVLNSPIVLTKINDDNREVYVKNAKLSDIDFFKVMDSYTCFQEIYMCMNSVYKAEKPVVEIEDKYKIQQHGFDVKASFRKSPTKKAK